MSVACPRCWPSRQRRSKSATLHVCCMSQVLAEQAKALEMRENMKTYIRGMQAKHKQLKAANAAYRRLLERHGIPTPPEPAVVPRVRMRHTCLPHPAGGCGLTRRACCAVTAALHIIPGVPLLLLEIAACNVYDACMHPRP